MKVGKPLCTLHTSNYDFNDDMIATGAYFFLRIIEDRLNLKLFEKDFLLKFG